jgi:MoaA/NifB/PqqE/SkfB family radical SAM enzyme
MKQRAERIYEWSKGIKQGPVRIELHPTNKCNAKCVFCWQITKKKDFDYSSELSEEKLISLVNEAAAFGVREWIISGGGEPLVRHDETIKIMKLIKQKGMWGQLTTNGELFNEKDIEELVNVGWDQIQFSIDSSDSKIHDSLRGKKGLHNKAMQNFELFVKFKKLLGKSKPYMGFNVILNRKNYDKLDKMIELANQAGSQLVYFEPIYPGYLSKDELSLTKKQKNELSKHIKKASDLAKKYNISTNILTFLDKNLSDKTHFSDTILDYSESKPKIKDNKYLSLPCYQPWYLLGIKANGLAGCCSTFELGEDIHTKSLKEVWFSKTFDNIRKNLLDKKLPDYCKKCSVVVVMENKEIRNLLEPKFNGMLSKINRANILRKAINFIKNEKSI